jgi:trimeric autotransporter adhesin
MKRSRLHKNATVPECMGTAGRYILRHSCPSGRPAGRLALTTLTRAAFFLLFLMLCFANTLRAQDKANEIVCASATACKGGSIPVFSTSGGSAQVGDSLLTESGSTVQLAGSETLTGNLAASGGVSGASGSFSGNVSLTGDLSLVNSGASAGNVLKGGSLFLHNFGGLNTFLGVAAGNLTLKFGTANNNTGIGANALSALTTGCCNVGIGTNALLHNTTGGANTAIGDGALYSNSTGGNNTALGRWALISNGNGINNTATGTYALQINCTSSCLVGSLQLGSQNTATGVGALLSNRDGGNNTATGFNALYTNCSSPCYYGEGVGGGYNTATGSGALYHNTSGDSNTGEGGSALASNTTGGSNTALGVNALFSNTIGNFNTAVGNNADVSTNNLSNATAIGYGAIVNASDKIRLGNTTVTVIEGQVAYTFTSDRNQKENFQPVDGELVLRKISGLNLASWNYIGHDPTQFRHYGPVAQEFFAAFGHDAVGTIGTDKTINSGDVEGILMIAVQALEKRTEELDTLKAQNAELKARLEKLERASSSGVVVAKSE